MSVRQGERSQQHFEYLNQAKTLTLYTIQICSNEKIFPKSQRWVLSQRIINETLDILSNVRKADSIPKEESKENRDFIKYHLVEARAHLNVLLGLMDIAYIRYHIDSNRIEYWTGLCVDLLDSINTRVNL